MKFNSFQTLTLSSKGRFIAYVVLGIFACSALIFPDFAYSIIGTLIGIFLLTQGILSALEYYLERRLRVSDPKTLIGTTVFYVVGGILLLVMNKDVIRASIGYIAMAGLILYAIYQYTLAKKWVRWQDGFIHYLLMSLGILGAVVVAFNLAFLTEWLMRTIGVLLLAYAIQNLVGLVAQKK